VVLFNPGLVTGSREAQPTIDATEALENMGLEQPDNTFVDPFADPASAAASEPPAPAPAQR
jgi:hypothetical protein